MRFFHIFLIVFVFSCSQNSGSSNEGSAEIREELKGPKLYLNQITVFMVSGSMNRKDSLFTFNEPYLDISLYSGGGGSWHMAEKKLEKFNVDKAVETREGQSVRWTLVDSLKNEIRFKSSTEFLNYMNARGYEFVNQTEKKYQIAYTFKKH